MDPIALFRQMARARAFEEAIAALWQAGRISGEMHLGTGEEAVAAGVVACLRPGDAVALDHRATPVLTGLGVDLASMLRELLGREDGLQRGRAGHMHLMSRAHLAVSSGIVGSSAPLGAGLALAGRALRPGSAAVAFFGDGAMNQGMLLEALNLAAAWRLPLLFVCKDNGWAINTRSQTLTAGGIAARASTFGLPAEEVDGVDPVAVTRAVAPAIERARRGKGPSFIRAEVSRLDGHLLGDFLVRVARSPAGEGRELLREVAAAAVAPGGGGLGARAGALFRLIDLMRLARQKERDTKRDPLERARRSVGEDVAARLEDEARAEVAAAVESAGGTA
ncbi:MAG TPA: thiamine pyrophosphate-dependent dehydrogenase E1 component subunit alpha [Anaeromyxobacteraceae bacterium]|nr:thiamine pyrophosphate-dependent dehydrogenase E1 component subunit alpha [Anaeromyxobacteraceae bacterium]